MIKLILGLGLFALLFSFVWITATANGFEFLHANSPTVRSFSDSLYCGGDTFSISYGSITANPGFNKGSSRSFTALCTAANGTQRNVTNIKGALDVGIFVLLMVGGLAIMGLGIRIWIGMPIKASVPQPVEP